jgi:hypothetical protein
VYVFPLKICICCWYWWITLFLLFFFDTVISKDTDVMIIVKVLKFQASIMV